MGAFYGSKIYARENNPKTGEAWRLEDVPTFWKQKVEKWLKEKED